MYARNAKRREEHESVVFVFLMKAGTMHGMFGAPYSTKGTSLNTNVRIDFTRSWGPCTWMFRPKRSKRNIKRRTPLFGSRSRQHTVVEANMYRTNDPRRRMIRKPCMQGPTTSRTVTGRIKMNSRSRAWKVSVIISIYMLHLKSLPVCHICSKTSPTGLSCYISFHRYPSYSDRY